MTKNTQPIVNDSSPDGEVRWGADFAPTSSRKGILKQVQDDKIKNYKQAFTLAEVLITLSIVGVVAAITMPALIANIQDRVKTARIQNIKQKFGKATDKMKSLSTLGGYATTMDFVNELQKHLKIAKVCDNQHLTECWPTEKVIINDKGIEREIKDVKSHKDLKLENENGREYGETVGIVTNDGTAMILTYDTKCDIDEVPITWSNNQSSTSGCVAAVFDWNGSKMPNKMGADVMSLNGASLGCFFEINGECFKAPQPVNTYLTYAECMAKKDDLGLNYCCSESYCSNKDYFAGAAVMCEGKSNIASMDDIAVIANDIYGTTIGATQNKTGISYNASIGAKYDFPDANISSFWFWSKREGTSNGVFTRSFKSTSLGWRHDMPRHTSNGLVLCKE